ncbi:MAG: hypothetical protein M1536_02495 [Firmicutes bacterium]|nr:hypothetical protein [Bacillota bacterium]
MKREENSTENETAPAPSGQPGTNEKRRLVLDVPRFVILLITLIIGVVYYLIFDYFYDLAPYDARLTDTAVFFNFEKDRMNMDVYMFYENKSKSRERKQLLFYPVISNEEQEKPVSVEFSEKVLPQNFFFDNTIINYKGFNDFSAIENFTNDISAGTFTPVSAETTADGERLWLMMKPSEKKIIRARFSQRLISTDSSKTNYKYYYDFSNSKSWGIDLNNILYFVSLPAGKIVTNTDLANRKSFSEKLNYIYNHYYYPRSLIRLGDLPAQSCKREIFISQPFSPTLTNEKKSIYIIQYRNGFDPGIIFEIGDGKP